MKFLKELKKAHHPTVNTMLELLRRVDIDGTVLFQYSNTDASTPSWTNTIGTAQTLAEDVTDLILTVTIGRTDSSTSNNANLLAFVNDEQAGTNTAGFAGFYQTTLDAITVADGLTASVYEYAGDVTTADVAALPEPTALALLALGVAGIALRCRMA